MKKELVIEWECPKTSGPYCNLRIVKQTHRQDSFGMPGLNFHFTSSSGYVVLCSNSYPAAISSEVEPTIILHVRGEDSNRDNAVIRVPKKYKCLINQAVTAYNNCFSEY